MNAVKWEFLKVEIKMKLISAGQEIQKATEKIILQNIKYAD